MKHAFMQWIKALFLGAKHAPALSVLEEEAVQSPLRTVVRNFFKNKAAVFGLVTFIGIFVAVFCLSALYPLDATYQDVTQQNVSPGFNMASLPAAMKQSPRDLDIGSIFSVGADKDGNLHVWGKLTERQQQVPKNAKDIVQVSAGLDHMLALDSSGTVYTWGNNRFTLDKIPAEVSAAGPMKQVAAGHQFSLAVSQAGELFFWGNGNLIELDAGDIPAELQFHVASVQVNSSNVVVLLDDGTLRVLGRKGGPATAYPQSEGGFLQIAVSEQAAAGLKSDGTVMAWGNDFYGLLAVPEEIQGKTAAIAAGRFHFTALLNDGTLMAWGRNQFGQASVPKALQNGSITVTDLTSGYFANYVIDQEGTVHSFGLKGYLMGTDGAGRDIFRRLVSGGRLSLTVGAVAVLISVTLGVFVGGLAGFYGGMTDMLLMRLSELVDSIPFLPLAMTLSVLIGSRVPETYRIVLIMVILGLLSWPGMARLVRGQILSEREKEFVLAARATGIRERAIIFKYIVPNILTPIIIMATLSYASSLLTESALSFLGFGVAEPNSTWGNMLTDAQNSQVIAGSWWRWVFPSLAICLTTISINLIGDGLRNAIDPRSAER